MKKSNNPRYFLFFLASLLLLTCLASCEIKKTESAAQKSTKDMMQQAQGFEKNGEFKDAISIYAQLQERDPENPSLLYKLGRLLAWTNQWDEAEQLLNEALRTDPTFTDAKIQLGYIALWRGEYGLSERIFNEVLREYPDNNDAIAGLNKVLTVQNENTSQN